MVNKQKRKGTDWERQLVEYLNDHIEKGSAKRVAGSGAIGTSLGEPLLTGDVKASYPGFPRNFRIEAKTGYGGSKQLAIKKEWLDKIAEEASLSYAIPLLACKFSDAKSGVKQFIVLDISVFCDIINYVNELKHEIDLLYEEKK